MAENMSIPFPDKKYHIIYADPAWTFKVYSDKGKGRNAENHYSVSSLEDMKKLPVQNIAREDSILFMWATYPNLLEAVELIKAWGFEYKTVAFTWIKKNKKSDGFFLGLGYWTRANPEICLLATRGKPKRVSKGVRNLLISRIRRHSQKPDETRERIVSLMGDLSRIELFARDSVEGWDVWGNEVPQPKKEAKKEED
jgi:N6-adenosine-specific RNA methylase IME4